MIRMKKINYAMGILLSAAILSGCTLKKMVQLAADSDLQVDPNPLEAHGGTVPFDVSAVLPPKTLKPGKVYTLKTLYQYGDKEMEVGSVEFKADDFPNSSTSTSRRSESFEFPYSDELNPGKLFLQGVASDPRNGKSFSGAKLEVATGIITTSKAVKDVYLSAFAEHGYNDKEELIPTNVDFYFPQGRSTLSASLKTDGTSNRDKQNNLSAFIADKNVTRTVTITGTHSPEGSERINSNLSQDRAERIESYYRSQMRKYDYKGAADSIKFILKPVVEDWTALRNALRDYTGISSSEKSAMMRIIDGTGTFEDKEKKLRDNDAYDKVFKEIYPTLRTAKTEILTVKPKKSNAEIAVLAKGVADGNVNADTLSSEEMLFAGTLTPSALEKAAIYKAATQKDGSWVAHNNLAAAYLLRSMRGNGDVNQQIEDALTQLEIAANKNAAAEVHANFASAYTMQGEYGKAYEHATKALEKSPSQALRSDLNGLKGAIEIRMGNYDAAQTSLASATTSDNATFDRGLANLLNKDFSAADTFFGDATSSKTIAADAYYYKAVTAARRNAPADVTSNLVEAVKLDSSLKEKALADLEFTKYASQIQAAF